MSSREWPADWDERMAGRGCVMCESLGRGDNEYWVHVADLEQAEVHLERRTRVRGYCLVVWRHGHAAEPTELEQAAACGYWRDVLATGRAVAAVFAPLKVNYLTLGNSVPHLHTHVDPRYRDDPEPGAPLPWDDVVGSKPVDETELRGQAERLREALAAAPRR